VGCLNGELKPCPPATDAAIRGISPATFQSTLGTKIARVRFDMIANEKIRATGEKLFTASTPCLGGSWATSLISCGKSAFSVAFCRLTGKSSITKSVGIIALLVEAQEETSACLVVHWIHFNSRNSRDEVARKQSQSAEMPHVFWPANCPPAHREPDFDLLITTSIWRFAISRVRSNNLIRLQCQAPACLTVREEKER
jgi:hypothetical protein